MYADTQRGLSHKGQILVIITLAILALTVLALIGNSESGNHPSEQTGIGVARSPEVNATATPERPAPTFEAVDTFISPENFPGVTAIEPSLDATDPDTPSFTAADVEQYISDAYPRATIKQIEFLSAEVVEDRYQQAPGAFGGRLLGVVSLDGEFHPGVPLGAKPVTASNMVAIFDANTGNQLMETYP